LITATAVRVALRNCRVGDCHGGVQLLPAAALLYLHAE
jgi:hypothetical protein